MVAVCAFTVIPLSLSTGNRSNSCLFSGHTGTTPKSRKRKESMRVSEGRERDREKEGRERGGRGRRGKERECVCVSE